jgi:hypothetical protein
VQPLPASHIALIKTESSINICILRTKLKRHRLKISYALHTRNLVSNYFFQAAPGDYLPMSMVPILIRLTE